MFCFKPPPRSQGWEMSKKQNQEKDTSSSEMTYMLFYVVLILFKYIIGALLLIWSVNTLFACGIPYSLKTVLASVTLLWVARLFLKGLNLPFLEPEDEEYYEEHRLTSREVLKILQGGGRKK
jgi:hypothetical protein